ncbi:MAG: serine/threonine protein kinase, partial [Planctomycetota bacterium]
MMKPESASDQAPQGEQTFADLVEEITRAIEAGKPVDLAPYEQSYPEYAERLRRLVPALQVLDDIGLSAVRSSFPGRSAKPPAASVEGTLGDFRIIREIGRGGMGVVHEAQQISLDRRVALKILPFVGMLDQRQLQRFKNEARAAAGLHHPNIVPVYSIGCERSVHFYAMQYVEGQTLARVIDELKALQTIGDDPLDSESVSQPTHMLLTGRASVGEEEPRSGDPGAESREPNGKAWTKDTEPLTLAWLSTKATVRRLEFFRSVARLGIQAAQALEYSHQSGVIHRDIKPSNLLIDLEGNLWISDFGLAQTRAGPDITMTGDVLGTLRYMSPEQATGRRRILDHRTDIYSLGATLYELVTLRPAVDADDRQRILRQISDEEPDTPRRRNGAIPKDLETIVLKAMAKEPERRYATAQELADDLERFLEDKLIRARRPSLVGQAGKWARRHRPMVWSAGVILVIAAMVSAGIAWTGYRRKVDLERSVAEHLAAARAFLEAGDFAAADGEVTLSRARLDMARYGEGPLEAHVVRLSEEVSAKIRARRRFEEFERLRTHVHSTMYHISVPSQKQALEYCRTTLNLFDVLDSADWKQRPEFQDLDANRQTAVQEGAVELLFLLARLEVLSTYDAEARAAAHRRSIDALRRIEAIYRPIPAAYLWMGQS